MRGEDTAMPYINNKQLQQLKKIASELREHIDNGCPQDLTFAPVGDMSPQNKAELQKYLDYNFKDIWGNTWIKGEAQAIDDILEWIEKGNIPEHGFLAGRLRRDYLGEIIRGLSV